jgi:hypothetical protein
MQVIKRLPTAEKPNGSVYAVGFRKVYVSNTLGRAVAVVDVDKDEIVTTLRFMGATRILTPTAIGVLVAVQARASARTLTRRCFEPGLVCCLSSELPRLMAGQRNATSTRRTRTASLRAPRPHLKEQGSPHVRGCSRSCCGVCDEAWPGCVTPNTWTSCPPSHPDTSSATTARADSANVRFVCACDAECNAKLIT